MQDYLKVIVPYLDPSLVNAQALSNIQSIAEILPPPFFALLECRLTDSNSSVDLSVALIREEFKVAVSNSLSRHSCWESVNHFYQLWTTPDSFPDQTVKLLGLEFDLNQETDTVTLPCCFLQLEAAPFENNRMEAGDKLLQLLTLLQNQAIEDQRATLLQHCINALPERAGITHLGTMLTRPGKPIRINVGELSAATIPHYLAQITGGAVDRELVEILNRFSPLIDKIVLALDIGEQISPRIGLECFFEQQPQRNPHWGEFLDILVTMNCCTKEKRDALLSWSGLIVEKDAQVPWPKNLKLLKSWMGKKNISAFYRKLSHLKLIYQGDCPLEAKAYLEFGHRWFKTIASE